VLRWQRIDEPTRQKELPIVSAFAQRFLHRAAVVACACAGLVLAGCQALSPEGWEGLRLPLPAASKTAAPAKAAAKPTKADADRAVLARGTDKDAAGRTRSVWIRAVEPVAGGWRWRYPDLDDLLARPAEQRPDFRRHLRDADPLVAANAAIALVRVAATEKGVRAGETVGRPSQADTDGLERPSRKPARIPAPVGCLSVLTAAVRTPTFALPMRAAAVEALASTEGAATVAALRELCDQYGRSADGTQSHYVPELDVELIRGLARHVDAADDPRFTAALRSPSADVRREALDAWSESRRSALPVELTDLRSAGDYRLRAAALQVMAKHRHPQAEQYAADAIRDNDLRVRTAAVAALGQLGGRQAQDALQGLLAKHQPERLRTEAVTALAKLGAKKSVLDASGDESWRVRAKVAEALAAWPDVEGAAAARRLLDDPSGEVQRAALGATDKWPLELAGPILLSAMSCDGFMTRKTAAGQLAARWPPAGEFPVEGPTARRAEVLGRLQSRFRQEFRPTDPAMQAGSATGKCRIATAEEVARVERLLRQQDMRGLAQVGPPLISALEQLVFDRQQTLPEEVYCEVLPPLYPPFAAFEQLRSKDLTLRRRAADQLATLTATQPLGRLAAARLEQIAAAEPDSLVWRSVLVAIAADPSESSVRLAYAAVGHPSPEVRRRACEHLAAHPNPQHARVLLPVLKDESHSVVCAAVRAIGQCGRPEDAEPLRRLSVTTNEQLQIEVAVALARLSDPTASAALERLTYSKDPLVVRQAALMMGELGDPAFTPTLVRLLNGPMTVARAALEALPKVAGRDVADGQPAENTSDRIRRWKQWYEQAQGGWIKRR
jgi:HEAT repeat protein